jgi:hypothetical protein
MLAITANKQKLPHVVFKCMMMAKVKFPHGIIVWFHESGWITEELIDNWLKSVWF